MLIGRSWPKPIPSDCEARPEAVPADVRKNGKRTLIGGSGSVNGGDAVMKPMASRRVSRKSTERGRCRCKSNGSGRRPLSSAQMIILSRRLRVHELPEPTPGRFNLCPPPVRAWITGPLDWRWDAAAVGSRPSAVAELLTRRSVGLLRADAGDQRGGCAPAKPGRLRAPGGSSGLAPCH